MPARLLREGILDSDAVNSLSPQAEVFYRRLMSVVDDFGRFDGRVPVLRGRLYALQPAIRETDISHWIAACVKAGLIALYERDGKPYILFRKLGAPRAKTSKYPDPPHAINGPNPPESTCAQMLSDAPYSGSDSISYSGAGSGAGARASPTHENNGKIPKNQGEPLANAARIAQERRRKSGGKPP